MLHCSTYMILERLVRSVCVCGNFFLQTKCRKVFQNSFTTTLGFFVSAIVNYKNHSGTVAVNRNTYLYSPTSRRPVKYLIMSLDERFQDHAEKVKNLKKKPNNEELLVLYGLFKQGTVGDVDTARPGMFDLTAKAKWDAWNGRKGMSQDEAKQKYIDVVEGLIASYGL